MSDHTISRILILLSMLMLTLASDARLNGVFGMHGVSDESAYYERNATAKESMTLAQVLQSFRGSIDWGKAIYAGILFNERNKTDLEAMIDDYAAHSDWLNVLKWTAICGKLGIERESAIKAALDSLPMVQTLPFTTNYSGTDYFCVESKFALLGYRYAEKFNYRLDKWNKTSAYNYLQTTINNTRHPVLFVGANGKTYTITYGPRYYDESACTIQCFIIFYELGITEALNDAVYWWNWTNSNLWYQNTHYKYGLTWADYECEMGFFAKIVSNLRYYKPDLENWSRVLTDLQNRFLIDRWDSKQWFSSSENKTTYVTVHHYPSNPQRRLQNTLGAWTALHALHDELPNATQNAMEDMLGGYDGLYPAWRLLMSTEAKLYDISTDRFRWSSDSTPSDDATAYAMTLMALTGIIPKTATLAFPIEEYCYEYIYDIDPELYNINLDNSTIRLSITKGGELQFIYGTSPVSCNLPERGIYDITFSSNWNNATSISRIQDLPPDRKFNHLKHDIAITDIALSNPAPEINETIIIYVTTLNKGNFTETFQIIADYTRLVDPNFGNETITLNPQEAITLNFTLTLKAIGTYEIKAYTTPIRNEIDTTDNMKIRQFSVGYARRGRVLWRIYHLPY